MTSAPTSRGHPFGRGANWCVLGGTSLSVIQSLIVLIAVFLAPGTPAVNIEGPAVLVWLGIGLTLPLLVGWTAWRALRSWWRRSVRVVPRLLLAAVVAVPSTVLLTVPIGEELLTPIGYLPAGLLILAGAILARPRVERARAEGRGGLGE
ncbi:MAG: hypothetical protein ACLFRD_11085 [Nitriliruptoraceae bacterium]